MNILRLLQRLRFGIPPRSPCRKVSALFIILDISLRMKLKATLDSLLFQTWQGIQYLFDNPGYFLLQHCPSRAEHVSETEWIAARVNQDNLQNDFKHIERFLIP